MLEDIGALVGVGAVVGRHIFQQRFFAEIEFDDLRHERIDCLVVGDAGAGRVDQRHIARAIGVEHPRDAQHRIRFEGEGVEIIVVDPAIDHVDPPRSHRGPRVDLAVLDEQILSLAELGAHLVGEEAVLEIG